MLYGFLIFMHIVVSLTLVIVILLQSGRGGGLAGSMGGSMSTAMFGGQGADKLMTRLTGGLAATFMILAILISLVGGPNLGNEGSIVREQASQRQLAPLQPVTNLELPELANPAGLPLPPAEDNLAQPEESSGD